MRRVVIVLGVLLCVQFAVLLAVVAVRASRPMAAPLPTDTPTHTTTATPTWTRAPTWTPTPTATAYIMPTNTPTPAPLPTPTRVAVRTFYDTDSEVAAQLYLTRMEPLLTDLNDWGNRLVEVGDSASANPYGGCEADYEDVAKQGAAVVEALAAVEVPEQIAADHELVVNTLGDTLYHLRSFRVALCVQRSEYLAMQELELLAASEGALTTSTTNINNWLSQNR